MKRGRGIFVTGTDTGVGKTLVAELLVEVLRREGVDVGVMKPYASGGWNDTDQLRRSAAVAESRNEITPVYCPYPVAPGAVRQQVDAFHQVKTAFRRLAARHQFLVVEGIGGVQVPLDRRLTVADMIRAFDLSAWIVARPGLGTLNHTLMSWEILSRRGVRVAAIILSGYLGKTRAERSNARILREWTKCPVWLIPRIRDLRGRQKALRVIRNAFFVDGRKSRCGKT